MFDYILLGIIQGVFEWLPISSEGVVALASSFFIQDINPLELAIFLHLGTLLAVLIYFRKDWIEILTLKNTKLFRFLIISSFISGIVGFISYNLIKDFAMGAELLFVVGCGLLITAYFHKTKKDFGLSFDKLAIVSGFLQGLAVIPGLSRSGSTIFGLSLGRLEPAEILKISYIMSAPVIIGSSIFLFWQNNILFNDVLPALLASFITGLLFLRVILNLAKKISFYKFALFFALLCFVGGFLSFFI